MESIAKRKTNDGATFSKSAQPTAYCPPRKSAWASGTASIGRRPQSACGAAAVDRPLHPATNVEPLSQPAQCCAGITLATYLLAASKLGRQPLRHTLGGAGQSHESTHARLGA